MKIRVDVEMTPAEMRELLGWPDVRPLQEEFLARARAALEGGEGQLDPGALMRAFLPTGAPAFEAFQRAFMAGMARARSGQQEGEEGQEP